MKATPIAVSVFMSFVPAARVELRLNGTFRGEADQREFATADASSR